MNLYHKDGVALACESNDDGPEPMLFVHGWGCDHTVFSHQFEYFYRRHRVAAVDLRGHGQSDAPCQDYTLTSFAEDVAWLCHEVSLHNPMIVGHSMGGAVALEFAARYPGPVRAVVLIDSVLFPPEPLVESLRPLAELLHTPGYLEPLKQAVSSLFLAHEESERERATRLIAATPQHVLASSFPHHVTEYDAAPAASRCRVPVAYIQAQVPLADLRLFRDLCPQLVTAQTLGAGHFSPLLAPHQINAMLEQFMRLSAS